MEALPRATPNQESNTCRIVAVADGPRKMAVVVVVVIVVVVVVIVVVVVVVVVL